MSKSVGKSSSKLSDTADNKTDQFRLSKQQLKLLDFMYTYRFVTTKQVQRFLGKQQVQQAQQRLNTLLAKEYIGKNFSSDDRLLGRYASYFLLPNGLALLKYNGDPKALKLMRKDATASERFVTHCIAIGDVAADLLRLYHDAESIQFSTKTELMREDYNTWDGSDDHEFIYNYFPQPLPDGSLNFYRDIDDDDHHCFVEVWQDTIPFWVYRKRIQYYIEYTDEGAWGDANSVAKQPPVLLVCDSPTLQRRVQRYLKRIVDEIDSDELKFLVVNRELLAKAEADAAIWHTYDEDQEKFVICKLN